MKHIVRRTNPRSKWPYRIVRTRELAPGRTITHKLHVKFETAEAAQAYIERHADQLSRIC